jgi:rhodanese-related sulfurtransferase
MSTSTPELDIDRFAAAHQSGVVVDVRERGEYAAGHVPGALLIPMGQLASRMDELDRSHPVYVICATGNRSRAMTDLLRAAGFDAANVAGGTTAWARSGRPVEGGLR